MTLLGCGLVGLLILLKTQYLPLALLYRILPPHVQGGRDVVLQRLVLNKLAADRADREYDDESSYPDDGDEDNYKGPLTIPTDWPGLFSDDVSCLLLLWLLMVPR